MQELVRSLLSISLLKATSFTHLTYSYISILPAMKIEHFLITLPFLFWICTLTPPLLALLGIVLFRKFINPENRKKYHDTARSIMNATAGMYSIMAAFIVASAWTEYADIKANVNKESETLQSLYSNTLAFSPSFTQEARTLYQNYRAAILKNEWKTVQPGKDTVEGDQILKKLDTLYSSYSIRNDKELAYFKLSIAKLDKLQNLRTQRIENSSSTLLPMLWLVLLLGGLNVILISSLIASSQGPTHALILLILAIAIGLINYAIISLDLPFVGEAKISEKPFSQLVLE